MIYDHRKFRKDSIVKTFKMYRSNSTPIHHHRRSNQGESRNQPREMRVRQRDQPATASMVMMDRQIYQHAADPLLPHKQLILMWTQLFVAQQQRTMSINIYLLRINVIRNHFRVQPITSQHWHIYQHPHVPYTSQTIHPLPTAYYPSVHALTTSDPPYKNITRYNPVCAPTAQRNDNVHYQSSTNPAAPLTWGLSPTIR